MMQQNMIVYFSFFNPLKVTDELEIESLEWVHGFELTMGRNRYKPLRNTKENTTILELPWTANYFFSVLVHA